MKSNIIRLISAVAKAEGLKTQTSVGNVREILRVLKNICKQDATMLRSLLDYLVK